MVKSLLNKNYIFYGGSIIISRGLEYFILFFAAGYLTKGDYGQLEFYKKFIEVVSSILAFGFPALILSYTRSTESKRYFYFLSTMFVILLGIFSALVGFFYQEWLLLLPALIFYALFFTGSVTQSYQLVQKGSNYASIYKILISVLFYSSVFVFIYFLNSKGKSYIYPSYFLLPIALLFSFTGFHGKKVEIYKIKKYWKLFKKLLYYSFTLVISNFAGIMFLYTDIFVIKLLSDTANSEIADFSFALNVASVLLIVSTTLVQVDIEKLKTVPHYLTVLNRKIIILIIVLMSVLVLTYYIMTNSAYFIEYKNTFILFLIILTGKVFASMSHVFAMNLTILKKFSVNLNINLLALILNVFICLLSYHYFGIIGLAVTSSCMLAFRFLLFRFFSKKYYFQLKRN